MPSAVPLTSSPGNHGRHATQESAAVTARLHYTRIGVQPTFELRTTLWTRMGVHPTLELRTRCGATCKKKQRKSLSPAWVVIGVLEVDQPERRDLLRFLRSDQNVA